MSIISSFSQYTLQWYMSYRFADSLRAGSGSYSFRPQYGPGVDSACNRNEYQEYFLGSKGGRCGGLTALPPSCADCLEIWEPQPPGYPTSGVFHSTHCNGICHIGLLRACEQDQDRKPSGRTMTLGLTQPATEMSTRNIS